ncbi:hypothetical protein PPTG_23278 [Phytophthora nicotianae INRA-310]|uniref:Uncharacterized protein n=1 Tax=Phytophthora nicotianae (strain INRA-310) TaxID=761204 RepID=W2Q2U6_PHYN3|nr:hypothetical protein PPTG_23278 [Phytophthora nicotianae INRA-310]ETN06839.1 hypothetical protein PPTG_23278 [Phytophthora nicotianae INRA-310]
MAPQPPIRQGNARLLLPQLVGLNKCLPAHCPAPSRANRATVGLPLPDKLQVQLHVKVGQPYMSSRTTYEPPTTFDFSHNDGFGK